MGCLVYSLFTFIHFSYSHSRSCPYVFAPFVSIQTNSTDEERNEMECSEETNQRTKTESKRQHENNKTTKSTNKTVKFVALTFKKAPNNRTANLLTV